MAATRGANAAAEYYAAYILEKSLSVDNIFVWAIYPFAGLILLAAWRILFGAEPERRVVEEACNVCTTWIARIVRVSPVLDGDRFWRRERGRLVATPLLVALVVIETTDIVFALDSVPAVLAVTRDPMIVYTSNVMAILGMRSIYFVLADTLNRLRFLRQGLAVVLLFTAGKMLASDWIHISPGQSILVIGAVLLATVGVSAWAASPRRPTKSAAPAPVRATKSVVATGTGASVKFPGSFRS